MYVCVYVCVFVSVFMYLHLYIHVCTYVFIWCLHDHLYTMVTGFTILLKANRSDITKHQKAMKGVY